MARPAVDDDPVRLAEVACALSLATDLGTGVPDEQALRTCILACELADDIDVSAVEARATYYLALLRAAGCSATAHELLDLFGDDVGLSAWQGTADLADPRQMVPILLREVGRDRSLRIRVAMLVRLFANMPRMTRVQIAHCEVARQLAPRLGLPLAFAALFDAIFERWDGKGVPGGLKADAIALPVRIVQVAHSAETYLRYAGREGAVALLGVRAGSALDPGLVQRFLRRASTFFDSIDIPSPWTAVLEREPGGRTLLRGSDLDEALRAIADFADLKSPHTIGHSRGVADLAAAAAQRCGMPESEVKALRRAAWLHDLGRVAISAAVWEKSERLSDRDWEAIRLHPYYTERVTARAPRLASLGAVAALHHERLDGTGYHRGLVGATLGSAARILAAADVFQALIEPRPHRPAFAESAAADILRSEIRAGRLDRQAGTAVLEAIGQAAARSHHRVLPGGLTTREVEVLRLIARGASNRDVAARLIISPKTARNHIQSVYAKLGISTRAAATLFALQHGLIDSAL